MAAAFPLAQQGRLPHQRFRGLHGVHVCYGLPARQVAFATLYIRGSGSFVTSTTAPIATGWSNSCQVGLTPLENYTYHGALSNSLLCPKASSPHVIRPNLLRVAHAHWMSKSLIDLIISLREKTGVCGAVCQNGHPLWRYPRRTHSM